jgi:hypothetical protein
VQEGSLLTHPHPHSLERQINVDWLPNGGGTGRRALSFSELRSATEFFGYSDDPEENIAECSYCEGYAGLGWYMWCEEYPEEGSLLISKDEKPTIDMLIFMTKFFDVVDFDPL